MPAPRAGRQLRKEPRQERSHRTRRRILEAAAQVFAESGYAATTTDRIAVTASVSVGSLYQYFPNKDAILLVLGTEHLQQAAEAISWLLSEQRPLSDWLGRFVELVIAGHAHAPGLHQVIYEHAPRLPALMERFRLAQREVIDSIAERLRTDPGLEVPQPDRLAWLIATTVESATHRYFADRPDFGAEQLAADLTIMLRNRLAPTTP